MHAKYAPWVFTKDAQPAPIPNIHPKVPAPAPAATDVCGTEEYIECDDVGLPEAEDYFECDGADGADGSTARHGDGGSGGGRFDYDVAAAEEYWVRVRQFFGPPAPPHPHCFLHI